ncbi:hypothetical protein ACFQY0_08865 [Haloferula chungangensis]|uniref:DUF927 domain-containing protein n=1 Tax=Haloferula chungangensis TaxID=1048331 RepID=A0ABW2L6L6_9BACT
MSDKNKVPEGSIQNQLGLGAEAAAIGVNMKSGASAAVVMYESDLNRVAQRIGEYCRKLDIFLKENGQVVYFDHRWRLCEMTPKIFRTWINGHVVIAHKFDEDGKPVVGTLREQDAAAVLVSESFRMWLRPLTGVNDVRLPVIRKLTDGELQETVQNNGKTFYNFSHCEEELTLLPEGYDEETQSYTVPSHIEFDLDLDLAVGQSWFRRTFGEFPVADDRSFAVHVAAMLAPFIRYLPGGFGLRPGFLWDANESGSGKTVMAQAALCAVYGHAKVAKKKSAEDWDKELEAFQRSGREYILVDNLRGGLNSPTVEQMMTSTESVGRSMGGHDTYEADNRLLIFLTGNDTELEGDSVRRFLVCSLEEPGDPNSRVITTPYLTDSQMRSPEWRAEALAALWALVRVWWAKGRPAGPTALASFQPFTELLGGIVTANLFEDPCVKSTRPCRATAEDLEFQKFIEKVVEEIEQSGDLPDEDGVIRRKFDRRDLAEIARRNEVFQEVVGERQDGVSLTIRKEGLTGDLVRHAVDKGYLDGRQEVAWGKLIKKRMGKANFEVDGKRVRFGDRREKHGWRTTVEILGGV